MPILKQLVSGSSQTKRRSRMDLTREMISSPLGDFRHTMHVGRSGDAFGDTSFLSSRSGEPPPPPPGTTSSSSCSSSPPPYPHSPRPGFLTRTFRSSKRSQSVNRVDQHRGEALLASPGHCSSPGYVKNAMSLPFLNDEGRVHGAAATKSLTSSPLRQPPGGAANGNADATAETRCLELEERSFGELTELPEAAATSPYRGGGGMKRAESVMSFHIDLGPSMLGDILGVMEKEDDDLGYEEGKGSDGHASPPLSTAGDDSSGAGGAGEELDVEEEELDVEEEEEEEELQHDSMHAGSSVDLGPECGAPDTPQCTPEARPKQQPKHRLQQQHLDNSSLSSSGSVATEPGEKKCQRQAGIRAARTAAAAAARAGGSPSPLPSFSSLKR
ncbi:hypothetical protein CRUP_033455 [Coryphaenoides rupestris]|nr:hypothetical protein CRUP_033455 [Coryphaenoides rupestris]